MPVGTATVMPYAKMQLFTTTGVVASGYKLFSYLAGTATKSSTYQDSGFAAANTNPTTLDSAGRATIFLDPAITYKFILATPTTADPPAGGDIVWTVDGVGGVPFSAVNVDVSGIAGEVLAVGAVVYVIQADGTWHKTDSNAASTSVDARKIGIVVQGGGLGEAIVVRTEGRVAWDASGQLGNIFYLSTTAGELTPVAPTGGENLYAVAVADTSTSIIFPVNQTASIALRTGLKTFAYSAGQSNAGGGGDTQLTSYDVPLPDNYFDTPGAALIIEGTLAVANNADANKAFKCQVGAGTLATLWASAAAVAGHIVPFRMVMYRRTATTAAITGIAFTGAAAAGAPTNYLVNTSIAVVDWTSAQTLKFYAASTTAATVTLTDLIVYGVRSYRSATV